MLKGICDWADFLKGKRVSDYLIVDQEIVSLLENVRDFMKSHPNFQVKYSLILFKDSEDILDWAINWNSSLVDSVIKFLKVDTLNNLDTIEKSIHKIVALIIENSLNTSFLGHACF